MQKHAEKIRLEPSDCPASDGYYVFVTLIGVVATMTFAILLGLVINTLA